MPPARRLTPSHDREAALFERGPEQLVGLAFRCALTCLRTGSGPLGEAARSSLCEAMDRNGLPPVCLDCFLSWGLAIECSAVRPLSVLPLASPSFCDDECLSVALVAAAQHDRCPAMLSCVFALLGTDDAGRALAATGEIAEVLRAFGAVLESRPDEVLAAPAWMAPHAGPAPRRLN